MEKHFFSGANTPYGFYNCFNNICDFRKNGKAVHIKGGSGCGKSTFMKKFAKIATDNGYEIEYIHCASDPDSLDGIHFVGANKVILDSTAPHNQDPLLVKFAEIIFDTQDFLNEELLKEKRSELLRLIKAKYSYYDKCYNILKGAHALYQQNEGTNIRLIENIADMYDFKTHFRQTGKERKLFASGITSKGCVNFLENILQGKIVAISDGEGSNLLLEEINKKAKIAGYNTETYYCPLFPDSKMEHLVIKDADLSFTTVNNYHNCLKYDEYIKLTPKGKNQKEIDLLVNSAVNALKKARLKHSEIEKIYGSAMDYKKMDDSLEKIYSFLEL